MSTYHQLRVLIVCGTALVLAACGTDEPADAPPAAAAEAPAGDGAYDSASTATTATAGMSESPSIAEQIDGLWMYTGLTTSDGTDLPLTGVFLFKDGVFLQQAVFDSEPFDSAGAMAHAGPVTPEPETGSVHLVAEQTIGIAPGEEPALSFRASTEHDVTVSREGDALTLVFSMGTGTVQEFRYVGPGEGQLYALENGALAFVDGHFILVAGDANGATTGYGTFEEADDALALNVIRWAETDAAGTRNLKDTVMSASFEGGVLELGDGRRFPTL